MSVFCSEGEQKMAGKGGKGLVAGKTTAAAAANKDKDKKDRKSVV